MVLVALSNFTHLLKFNLIFSLIWLSYYDLILINISDWIWLNFTILFDNNNFHLTCHFRFDSDFLIQFGSSFLIYIWLKYPIWFNIPSTYFTRRFWFNSAITIQFSHHLRFSFTQFYDLIQLPLHSFNPLFLIRLRYSYSVLLIIYPIQFNSEVPIQFELVIKFYLTHTAHIWVTIYDSNFLFWFNLTQNFLFIFFSI